MFAPAAVTSAYNPLIELLNVPDAIANIPYYFTQRLPMLSANSANNVLTVNHPELLTKLGVYGAWKKKTDLEQAAIARGDLQEALGEFWAQTKGESELEGFTEGGLSGRSMIDGDPLNQL